ncbi:antibiotic biosynthesis monooxygenase [Enemella evansiae]|uniref:antibiotic biosynthesis monooxygenase family protein n=1 Tax=Enemella evansiae TaxID=2016499 RepID=UPI000B977F4A|nr:antibiotic biosynthesis monooxygenase [Enemella evansiae]OYO00040.1 antibiotic biosynthesis monooxygenase [Enemella evansiae]
MSVVVINALEVPENAGPELEQRFASRKHSVDGAPGFEGFQLLRPTDGRGQYFVVTRWASQQDFENWRSARTPRTEPSVSTSMDILQFEVVDL